MHGHLKQAYEANQKRKKRCERKKKRKEKRLCISSVTHSFVAASQIKNSYPLILLGQRCVGGKCLQTNLLRAVLSHIFRGGSGVH